METLHGLPSVVPLLHKVIGKIFVCWNASLLTWCASLYSMPGSHSTGLVAVSRRVRSFPSQSMHSRNLFMGVALCMGSAAAFLAPLGPGASRIAAASATQAKKPVVAPLAASSLMNMPPAGTVVVDTLKRVVLRHKESVRLERKIYHLGEILNQSISWWDVFLPCGAMPADGCGLLDTSPSCAGPRGDCPPARWLRHLL